MLEQSLRKLFEQQTEAELPPGRITVADVLRQGRLRRRRHRISALSAPVLAGVAVAAIALTGTLPSGTLGRTSSQASGRGRLSGGAFDPSYLAISLGQLPASAVVTGGEITPGVEALSMVMPDGEQWAVGVYARNVCHVTGTRRFECLSVVNSPTLVLSTTLSVGGHGPVVDGHQSLWLQGGLSQPGGPGRPALDNGTILAWQYAPGAWTLVQHLSSQRDAATAARIARAIEYGQHVPVRFASRFTSLPHDWRISALAFTRKQGVNFASTYSLARPRTIKPGAPVFAASRGEPLISISPANSASRCGLSPDIPVRHVTIHGYPFTTQRFTVPGRGGRFNQVMSALCGNHVDGLLVGIAEVTVGGPAFPPSDVMQRLQLLGTNPADWVTNPLS
jgi:hypothetical protein